jgi:hypothetical protein
MDDGNVIVGIVNLAVAAIALGLAIPLARRRVAMNRVYGVRFARSFESDELWYTINEYGGRRTIGWSLVLAAMGVASFFASSVPALVLLSFAPLILVVPCIQAYRFAQRL